MAYTGNEIDFYKRKFNDMITHQLQQDGSKLEAVVTIEDAMGERTSFDKMGSGEAAEHTARFEEIAISRISAERRLLTPTTIFDARHVSDLDIIRAANNPQSDVVKAITMALARKKDDIIIAAAVGTAMREVEGSASNVTFDTSNSRVADTFIGYSDLSAGSTMLHEGKLQEAARKLQAAEVEEPLFVIANANQLANLRYRAAKLGWTRTDFLGKQALTIPGLDEALDGFLGMRFIRSERVPQVSSKDNVLVLPKSAIKMGQWKALRVDVREKHDHVGFPLQVYADETIGAVRMDELKIISVLNATS